MLTVWKFVDGKRGHENQSTGLVAALRHHVDVDCVEIRVDALPPFLGLLAYWVVRKRPNAFPAHAEGSKGVPDLIIGAGRRTHLPIAVAKSLCGGIAIVLMRPSLPISMFDLVVVPTHDGVPPSEKVVQVSGVLNDVPFDRSKEQRLGLMLLGGVSAHYDWDDRQVVSQVEAIVNFDREVRWTVTTSRRTPPTCNAFLRELSNDNLEIVPIEETSRQWMLDHYASSGQIWVTPDSVSMVYEALSSGAVVRIFSLNPIDGHGASRVVKGLEQLIAQSLVLTFEQWEDQPRSTTTSSNFNEAERVATMILERLT